MQGDAVAAVRSLEAAEAIGREAASPNADLLVTTSRWCSSVDRGELDLSMLDAIPEESLLQTWVLITKAYGCAAVGRHDDARALLDAAATGLPELHPDSEYLPTLVQAATAVIALGGHALASWLYDALLPHRHRFTVEGIGAYCHGSVERHLAGLAAVLGRDADARKHFAAAREANAKGGAGLVELTARAESVATVRPAETPGSAVFRRAGDVWEVGLAGRAGHVKDGKGMRDLGVLLTRPRQAVAAVDLVAPGPMPQEGDTGELVDAQARAAYRRRLRELEEEVDDAAAAADNGRLERATAERDALVAHLTSAYGLGGRARKGGDPRERARTAVTARIRDAIHRIERVDAELGEHLRRSVQTGTFCSYDPVAELRWEL
jgi:hypothetical protein